MKNSNPSNQALWKTRILKIIETPAVMIVIIMVVIKLMSMITKNKPGVEKREQETDHCGYAKPQSQMEETSAVKI